MIKRKYHNLLILIILLFSIELTSCDIQPQKNNDIFYYYGYRDRIESRNDTVNKKTIKLHNPNDSLISTTSFYYKKNRHVINGYSNIYDSAIDGGYTNYELDDIGIIYGKSLTWPSYIRLKSNNDSINTLIDISLDHIILNSTLLKANY